MNQSPMILIQGGITLPRWKVTRTVDGFWRVGVGIHINAVFTDWRDAIDYAARKAWS